MRGGRLGWRRVLTWSVLFKSKSNHQIYYYNETDGSVFVWPGGIFPSPIPERFLSSVDPFYTELPHPLEKNLSVWKVRVIIFLPERN